MSAFLLHSSIPAIAWTLDTRLPAEGSWPSRMYVTTTGTKEELEQPLRSLQYSYAFPKTLRNYQTRPLY